MGDPAGVGPEICLRALQDSEIKNLCHLIVFGDLQTLRRCENTLGVCPHYSVLSIEQVGSATLDVVSHIVVDFQQSNLAELQIGVTNADSGEAAFQFVQRSIDVAIAGGVQAVVTAPISKEALHAAGHYYPGHTEMFAERCATANADKWCMMQFSPEITCTFVTVHCGYAEVPNLLTIDRILDVLELTRDAMRKIHLREPKIVVCGLNPHAGEHGLFGNREEELIITPAIEKARAQGMNIEGPLPPDTAFLKSKRKVTDAFVCMYHDQGHIPVKALAFDSAVNTTLGISVVRTSVDHGTACDIAWQGKADPSSLFAAIRLAVKLSS